MPWQARQAESFSFTKFTAWVYSISTSFISQIQKGFSSDGDSLTRTSSQKLTAKSQVRSANHKLSVDWRSQVLGMPRSRGSEMPQRQSPRGPVSLRTSSSDSDPLHHRPITDQSPKLGDRRSPRGGVQSDSAHQKKLGTRIANLESQLGQAQQELKFLKDQLASAEAAKKVAQEQLEKKTKKPVPALARDKKHPSLGTKEVKKNDGGIRPNEVPDDGQLETDVFEVPEETVQNKVDFCPPTGPGDPELPINEPEPQKLTVNELALKNDEIDLLKAKLAEKDTEIELSRQEKDAALKVKLDETASVRAKETEMSSRLSQLVQELDQSKADGAQLKEKLEGVEAAKEALETEMKKLRVQTEQWRKAADAAAAVLSGGLETNGRRISERCCSMDKHYGNIFETPVGGYTGFVGSPGLADDLDEGFAGGKRKGSGIRMLGDLWKKKGQK